MLRVEQRLLFLYKGMRGFGVRDRSGEIMMWIHALQGKQISSEISAQSTCEWNSNDQIPCDLCLFTHFEGETQIWITCEQRTSDLSLPCKHSPIAVVFVRASHVWNFRIHTQLALYLHKRSHCLGFGSCFYLSVGAGSAFRVVVDLCCSIDEH